MAYPLLKNPKQHFYNFRRKKTRLILLHVTAGLEDLNLLGVDDSAEATNRYGASTTRAASWHSCVDSDSVAPALPDEYTAFHCKAYNSPALGLEICNRNARWDDKPEEWVRRTLLNAAKVCFAWEKKYGIPRRLLNKAQVDAGMAGYSYHMFLDPSRRQDPGVTFPWDYFCSLLRSLENDTAVPAAPEPNVIRPSCVDLQKAVRASTDNMWGRVTDEHCDAVIKASEHYGVKFPYGVAQTQKVVGAKADGQWGPKSVAAHKVTVVAMQNALRKMGWDPGVSDGNWGPKTHDAFARARKATRY